jgi:hypothetical protein
MAAIVSQLDPTHNDVVTALWHELKEEKWGLQEVFIVPRTRARENFFFCRLK